MLKLFSESVQSAAQSGSFLAITKMSKEIAVQHTGYTADRMMIVETEFEYDNGMAEYKVKFRVDGSKYNIKISPENTTVFETEIGGRDNQSVFFCCILAA